LTSERQSCVVNPQGRTFSADLDTKTRRHDTGVVLALARTHAYLEQFCSQIATETGQVCVDLPIRQYGVYKGLIQQDYELNRWVEADAYTLRLNFSLKNEENGVFEYLQAEKDTRFLAGLRKDGIRVLASRLVGLNTDSQRVMFELEGKIPVQLEFKADVHAGSVALCLSNFDMLGTRCYVLKPEQITDEFLHQMGRFILRRKNSFLNETLVVESYEPVRDDEQTSCNPVLLASEIKNADILEFDVAELFIRKTVVLRHHDQEQLFDSRRAACHIGRKYPADIIIRSRFVSRDHATLGLHDNQFLLHDHSRNGIYIKPAGQKMIHLHNAQYKLEGSGVFCVGETIVPDHPDIISYEVT